MNKEETKETALQAVVATSAILGMIIIMIPFALFNAWVIQTLYTWFLVPLGLPVINVFHVWGILLMINMIKGINTDNIKNEGSDLSKSMSQLATYFITALLALLIGLVLKSLI